MQIKLENIGIVKNSSIALNGLTVITGKNNSGKSTVGKTLYALFDAVSNISEKFEKDKCNYIKKTLDEIGEDLHFWRLIKVYNKAFYFHIMDDDIGKIYEDFLQYLSEVKMLRSFYMRHGEEIESDEGMDEEG